MKDTKESLLPAQALTFYRAKDIQPLTLMCRIIKYGVLMPEQADNAKQPLSDS